MTAQPPGPETDTDTDPPQLDIDWVKTAAGALAAVTTAVLLSTLGAAGTLIGAALGSVAATVGSALYAQGLARSRHAVLKAQENAIGKVGLAQAEVRRAGRRSDDVRAVEAHLEHADELIDDARADLAEPATETPTTPGLAERVRALPWKRLALLAVATFAVALVVISGFERVAGRSVSSYTGGSSGTSGSTVPGVNRGDEDQDDRKKDRPTDDATPSTAPSGTPSESATTGASETAAPSQTPTPTADPSPSPTLPAPTGDATPSPTASATP